MRRVKLRQKLKNQIQGLKKLNKKGEDIMEENEVKESGEVKSFKVKQKELMDDVVFAVDTILYPAIRNVIGMTIHSYFLKKAGVEVPPITNLFASRECDAKECEIKEKQTLREAN
jgi:hypothetical protein